MRVRHRSLIAVRWPGRSLGSSFREFWFPSEQAPLESCDDATNEQDSRGQDRRTCEIRRSYRKLLRPEQSDSPVEAPRYSPTTTAMIAIPILICRLEKIQRYRSERELTEDEPRAALSDSVHNSSTRPSLRVRGDPEPLYF